MNSPASTYSRIRAAKRSSLGKLEKLVVGSKVFNGDNVCDGLYTALGNLKTRDHEKLDAAPNFNDFVKDYENIIHLAECGLPIKPITEEESLNLLLKMKPNVTDLYNITPSHYLNAGPVGCNHFHLLLSALLDDNKNTTISEVNSTYAVVLFKGHQRDRTSSRSYRTISTCPLVAKALDVYIRDLNISF